MVARNNRKIVFLIFSIILSNSLLSSPLQGEGKHDVMYGCWHRQIDKTREKNTLSLCFQSDSQMHIVHGEIGGELDAAPATWLLKKWDKILIDTEICKIKYLGKAKFELSECSFDGVFDRK